MWCLIGTGIALAAGIALVVLGYVGVDFGLGTHDKTAVVTAAVAFGALLFAGVAAVLAMAAFWAASGTPDLVVTLTFDHCADNEPVFRLASGGRGPQDIGKQNRARVRVRNLSQYSARNPGVRITLFGFAAVQPASGWQLVEAASMAGARVFQWDGGADLIVHGGWSRALPDFNIDGAMDMSASTHLVVVEVVADGVAPKCETLQARGLVHAQWLDHVKALGGKAPMIVTRPVARP